MRKSKGGSSNTPMMSTTNIVIAVVFVTLALAALYWVMTSKKSAGKKEMFTSDDSPEFLNTCEKTKASHTIMLFYMETCPHCRDFEPIWDQFETYAQGNDMLTRTLCITRVPAEEREKCRKYKVAGFPTVILVNNKTQDKKEFKGARTFEALKGFVAQNVA